MGMLLGPVLLTAASAQASDYGVRVECLSESGCSSIALSTVCGTTTPVSISRTQVKAPSAPTSSAARKAAPQAP